MAERTRRRHSASDALLGRLERRYGCVRLGLAAMPFSAVLAAAVALAASYPAAVILVGGWAAVYMLVVTAAVTYRQQLTPEHLLSRVNTTGGCSAGVWGPPVAPLSLASWPASSASDRPVVRRRHSYCGSRGGHHRRHRKLRQSPRNADRKGRRGPR